YPKVSAHKGSSRSSQHSLTTNSFSGHSPDSRAGGATLTIFRPPPQHGLPARLPWAVKATVTLPCGAETWSFAFIKTHLSHRGPHLSTPKFLHAGAVGARNRAMSIRISLNICRDTASSAIWNVP